jgi:NADH-quinone oxidoreductase subunit C
MNLRSLLKKAQERYPDQGLSDDPLNPHAIQVPAGLVPDIFLWLRDEPDLHFDYFEFSTCTDRPPDHMDLLYYCYSYMHKHRLAVKVQLERDHPGIPTICHVWRNAEWNEREIFDLFGVVFTGHPDLRRLMMPDDWEGHPLRKDYTHPNLVARPD